MRLYYGLPNGASLTSRLCKLAGYRWQPCLCLRFQGTVTTSAKVEPGIFSDSNKVTM